MASLGALLRELRLKHAASLDDLARTTKIGARQLEALEADDLARLPAPPFVKGFIRAYCEALGEPAGEALALYRAAVDAPEGGASAGTVPPARPPRGRAPVLMSLVLLAVLGVALLALSLALRGGRGPSAPGPEPAASQAAAPAPQAPTATAVPGPEAPAAPAPPQGAAPPAGTPSGTAAAPPGTNTSPAAPPLTSPSPAPPAPAPDARAPYRLVARTSAPTWVRVRMGGGQTIEETIPGGETREWISNSPFVLTIGNAGGLTLELNGQVLPPLGKPGAVVSRLVVPPESP